MQELRDVAARRGGHQRERTRDALGIVEREGRDGDVAGDRLDVMVEAVEVLLHTALWRQRSEKATLPALLPVVAAPPSATACSPGTALEIVFPDGAVVRVPPTFDEETLARSFAHSEACDDPGPRLDLCRH